MIMSFYKEGNNGCKRKTQSQTPGKIQNNKKSITCENAIEDALKASEQNFRNSLDQSMNGVRISDNADHTSYVNKSFLDIFGYKNIQEVISSPPQERYTPEAHADWVVRHEKLLRGEPMPKHVEVDIIRKDGAMRNLEISMREVFWDGKEQNQTLYHDITERKQVEYALKLSEQNFRNSMDNSIIGIRISDQNDHTSYANKALLEIFGYQNIDEVKKSPPQEHYSPAAHASWVMRHEKLLRGEPMPKQVDIDIIRRDGIVRNLDVSMRDVFWDGTQQFQTLYNDITERKAAEAAFHESEEKYRLIVENSSDIIFTLNDAGDFIYISAAVKNILGYNATDLIGHPFRSVLHPDDIKIVQEAIQHNIMDGRQTPGGTEYRVRHFSGEWRWHNGTGNTVRDANGKFLYFIGMGRDITDMKRLTEETKRTNEKLNIMIKKLEEQQRQSVYFNRNERYAAGMLKNGRNRTDYNGQYEKIIPGITGGFVPAKQFTFRPGICGNVG
jgi:PAS domain S-box-containing protein